MKQELITRQQADRAVNQLLSVIVGRRQALASNHLENYIPDRLDLCIKLIGQEMENDIKVGNPEVVGAALGRSQRKLSSVQSLKVLAALISEVEWYRKRLEQQLKLGQLLRSTKNTVRGSLPLNVLTFMP